MAQNPSYVGVASSVKIRPLVNHIDLAVVHRTLTTSVYEGHIELAGSGMSQPLAAVSYIVLGRQTPAVAEDDLWQNAEVGILRLPESFNSESMPSYLRSLYVSKRCYTNHAYTMAFSRLKLILI